MAQALKWASNSVRARFYRSEIKGEDGSETGEWNQTFCLGVVGME